jgi:hypothetical protein
MKELTNSSLKRTRGGRKKPNDAVELD